MCYYLLLIGKMGLTMLRDSHKVSAISAKVCMTFYQIEHLYINIS